MLAFASERIAACAATTLALATAASAHVLTVGPSGADFTTIAAAVQSAADGDVLLVRTGQYAGFTLSGKGLSIVADDGANVRVNGSVHVMHLAASQVVVLAGLVVYGSSAPALVADSNQGALRVESSSLRVYPNYASTPPACVVLSDCMDVAFLDADILGAAPAGAFALAGVGLTSAGTELALDDTLVQGSWGEPGTLGVAAPGGAGADGLDLASGELVGGAASLRGGAGGAGGVQNNGQPGCGGFSPLPGGCGGNGVLVSAGASCRLFTSTAQGGAGGSGGTTSCGSHAADGTPGLGVSGAATITGGPARTMSVSRVAREGQSFHFGFDAPAGETVFVFWAELPGHALREDLGGCVLVANPFSRRVRMGIVPATGHLEVGVVVPELGVGVDALTRHVQALFVDARGQARLGTAGVVTALDGAF